MSNIKEIFQMNIFESESMKYIILSQYDPPYGHWLSITVTAANKGECDQTLTSGLASSLYSILTH